MKDVNVYDPVSGMWRLSGDMNHEREDFSAVVVDDKLYAIGGRDSLSIQGN